MMKTKQYYELVNMRKACDKCKDLANPSRWEKDGYDSLQIGPWSRWQGNIDAQLMVVGQDWGTQKYFNRWKGYDNPENPTNINLMELLKFIGFEIMPFEYNDQIGKVFFTNAILCLKQGNLQSRVKEEWFQNCGKIFLKPLIQIVKPQIVVALGEQAFKIFLQIFHISYPPQKTFGAMVDKVGKSGGIPLFTDTLLFPVYHCGRRIVNMTRDMTAQKKDWQSIKLAIENNSKS